MKRILVAFASRHGSTAEVAVSIAERLHALGNSVEPLPASQVATIDGYDGVVLGGALYTGHWHADARRLLKRHARQLEGVPLAVFALGPRTLAPADVAASRAQLEAELARLPAVAPDLVTVFGGAVDPQRLRFPFNRMPATDARDWQAIAAWADDVATLFGAVEPNEPALWGLQPARKLSRSRG